MLVGGEKGLKEGNVNVEVQQVPGTSCVLSE